MLICQFLLLTFESNGILEISRQYYVRSNSCRKCVESLRVSLWDVCIGFCQRCKPFPQSLNTPPISTHTEAIHLWFTQGLCITIMTEALNVLCKSCLLGWSWLYRWVDTSFVLISDQVLWAVYWLWMCVILSRVCLLFDLSTFDLESSNLPLGGHLHI